LPTIPTNRFSFKLAAVLIVIADAPLGYGPMNGAILSMVDLLGRTNSTIRLPIAMRSSIDHSLTHRQSELYNISEEPEEVIGGIIAIVVIAETIWVSRSPDSPGKGKSLPKEA
jgi:hypothetical protein